MSHRKLTKRQLAVLHVVSEDGPLTPGGVDYHGFTASPDAARSILGALERRRLVEATYTQGHRGRAYVITAPGLVELEQWDARDEETDA